MMRSDEENERNNHNNRQNEAVSTRREEDEIIISFSNFYHGLRHSLEVELCHASVESSGKTQSLDYESIVRQAKHQLFQAYYQELIAFHRSRNREDMAHQLQYLFNPYEQILRERTISGPIRDKSNRSNDSDSNDADMTVITLQDSPATQRSKKALTDRFPIASLYQMRSDEKKHLISSEKSGDANHVDAHSRPLHLRLFDYLAMFLPFLVWLPAYRHSISNLKNDIIAGITVGVMVIPQGMAYSLIAGMPPVYGLYTVMIPTLIYALLGTSRQLAVGPTAVSALMVSTSLQQMSTKLEPGSDSYIMYAIFFALFGGLIQLVMGICRLGFLVNFLSHPVLSGFTSAAAIIIALSQLNNFLGVYLPKDNRIQFTILNVAKKLPDIHFPTIAMGLAALGFLHLIDHLHFELKSDIKFTLLRKKFKIPRKINFKWLPASLLLVVVGILGMLIVKKVGNYDPSNNEVFGIHIVGKVPSGIGKPRFPDLTKLTLIDLQDMAYLLFPVIIMGFMESISTAKYYAMQRGYEIDSNQELIALGASNLIGALFRGFPCTGSLCRTAVNASSGAATPLAGFITGIVVLLTLLVLTPLFYYLPMPVLAALVIHSALHIPDFETAWFTYKTKGRDFALLLLAFIGTLFIGIMEGVLIAAVISLILVVFLSSRPSFCRLTRVAGTTAYQEVKKDKDAKEITGVLVTRFDSDMYFANVQYFKDSVKKFVKDSHYRIYAIVLDCGSINQVDSTAVSALRELKELLDKQHIELFFAQMKDSVQQVIRNGGIYERMQDHCFVLLHDAVLHAESVVTTRRRLTDLESGKARESDFSSYEYEEAS